MSFVRQFQVWALCFSLPLLAAAEDARPSLEYQIKASLIFNFMQFVEWPPESPSGGPSDTLRICLIGTDRFGAALMALEKQIIQGRRLEVVRLAADDESSYHECQVAFISQDRGVAASVLSQFKGISALTIGETDDFLDMGGVIAILVVNEKIVFDISRRAALNARLKIGSKLLRIARQVKD